MACLIVLGLGWGATQPMTKIAVSTGYGYFGLVFWQVLIGAAIMGVVCALRGTRVPLHPRALRLYLILAMIGTILPNTIAYQAAVHLPSGVMSLLLSTVPMFAFAIALPLGTDRFSARRFVGLLIGLVGVLIILAPSVDLGPRIPAGWAAIYLATSVLYAFEGNYVARWGTEGLDAIQVMLGVCLMALVVVTPAMLATGQYIAPVWPLPVPQLAQVAASAIHVVIYAAYVWLVGRTGAVFAVQVSYLVTGSGLIWARLILGETYAATLWLALAAMFAGMYLVQPRRKAVLAPPRAISESGL